MTMEGNRKINNRLDSYNVGFIYKTIFVLHITDMVFIGH
jgi:hypothetical protein